MPGAVVYWEGGLAVLLHASREAIVFTLGTAREVNRSRELVPAAYRVDVVPQPLDVVAAPAISVPSPGRWCSRSSTRTPGAIPLRPRRGASWALDRRAHDLGVVGADGRQRDGQHDDERETDTGLHLREAADRVPLTAGGSGVSGGMTSSSSGY